MDRTWSHVRNTELEDPEEWSDAEMRAWLGSGSYWSQRERASDHFPRMAAENDFDPSPEIRFYGRFIEAAHDRGIVNLDGSMTDVLE
jgi:hypothetical protein